MNKYLKLIFFLMISLSCCFSVKAASLDELYRDIVRDNNQGYLPIFVKNRKQPEMLYQKDLPPPPVIATPVPTEPVVNLIDERKLKEEAAIAAQLKWESTVNAVKENRVTPVDLEEINQKVALKDPKAIEILAWMNTKGVGAKQDLVQAFYLYQKAAQLNVPNAQKNAALTYKAMKREQRQSLTELAD